MTGLLPRRAVLKAALGAAGYAALGAPFAQSAPGFPQWVEAFRARARARGISDETYARVMSGVKPDTSVYALQRAQPEFQEQVWQYLNRRVSDWRISTGMERAKEYAPLLARIEKDYGVDRYVMLGLWGMETAFGDVVLNPKHMRPVIPALAALAWGEPRRRRYWEQELLNALVIIQRGWIKPDAMVGTWAGAMGHTQWMPEVWLNMGVDYNHDGRISPFGPPDDALAGTARYLLKRGNYRRGEGWGYEVRLPEGMSAGASGLRPIAAWQKAGVKRADDHAQFPGGEIL
jgi:membrane-bound lytic murein transglycosylase B